MIATVSQAFSRIASRALAGLALLAATFIVASTCFWAWRGSHALPFWDAWEFVTDLEKVYGGRYTLADFLRPANEHRIALPRALFFVDAFGFALGEKFLVASALLLLAGLAALITRLATRGTTWGPVTRIGVGAGLVAILFSGAQIDCVGWSFAVQYMAQSAFPAAACALVVGTGTPRARSLALAALFGIGATFSVASSLLLWPVLVLLALWCRHRSLPVLLLALVGAACWLVYFGSRAPTPQDQDSLPNAVLATVAFSLAHLGSPWQLGVPGSICLGAAGTLLLGATWWKHLRSATPPGAERALLAIAALWSLYSLAIGYGRHGLGFEEALARRYTAGPLLWWAALLAASLRQTDATRVSVDRTPVRWLRLAPWLGLVVLASVLVRTQGRNARAWMTVAEKREVAALSILLGDVDATRSAEVYPKPERLPAWVRVLAAHELSVFAEPRARLAHRPFAVPLRADAELTEPPRILPVDDDSPRSPLRRLTGTLPARAATWGDLLVITDTTGIVRGLGSPGWDVPHAMRPHVTRGDLRWFALVPRDLGPQAQRWFVVAPGADFARALPQPR